MIQLKSLSQNRWFNPLLLLLWIIIGIGLRFSYLELKPIWTDEFATMVFSLGNTFHTVPLDRAIAIDTLLQPLQPLKNVGIGDVIDRLLSESTHPPVYFVLAHLWLKLFPLQDNLVNLWASRALSALFGVASIPAMYGLGWLAFRSRLVGQLAAAMMAVSPYSIFLSQEARHYTFAILLVIASLSCFIVAARALHRRTILPVWVGFIWIAINSLGIATHYFFALSLIAQGLVFLSLIVRQLLQNSNNQKWKIPNLRVLLFAALGTLAGGLVWLPVWLDIRGSELTKWVYEGDPLSNFFLPILRSIMWAIAMLSLLPVDVLSLPLPVVITFGVAMVIFVIWAVPIFWRGLKLQVKELNNRFSILLLGGYVLGILLLIFGFTYGFGTDLTLAARFHYIYFPGAIALLAASIAAYFNIKDTRFPLSVAIILIMGFLGGLTVIGNLGYLQHERCDILARVIQKQSQYPVLVATTHKHHGQNGRMMGLAWEFKRLNYKPMFLLAHKHQGLCNDNSCNDPNKDAAITLPETVAGLPKPLDVWLLNFHAPELLENQNCVKSDRRSLPKVEGFRVRHYQCK